MTEEMQYGTVYLVGAGPGNPELITKKGHDLLQKCDAVVYDDLVAFELVASLPSHIARYYAGKRAGCHSKVQNETNDLIIRLARQGLNVVRLKGGDPLIFGRGGEEAASLREAGVPFEIVPGVTAVSAVAAGAGIPLTDRRDSSWLLMATGHEAKSASLPVPWEKIAKLRGGTIAVYMGVGTLPQIVEKLVNGGADPETPAAAISDGYTGAQRIVEAPLHDLPNRCHNAGLKSPAIVIIGDVASHARYLSWKKPGALAGKRVLVTRPFKSIGEICRILRGYGADLLPLPTISIEPFNDIEGWSKVENVFGKTGWCVFTSRSGVEHFFDGLWSRGYDLRSLSGFRIAVIGPGTAQALQERGLRADLVSGVSRSEELAKELITSSDDLKGVTVLRIRGDLSDDSIDNALTKRGAELVRITVYRTVTSHWESHWINVIKEQPPDYITFTSGSTVRGFVEILGKTDAAAVASEAKVISIGPSTTAIADELGLKVDVEAEEHTIEGVVKALLSCG